MRQGFLGRGVLVARRGGFGAHACIDATSCRAGVGEPGCAGDVHVFSVHQSKFIVQNEKAPSGRTEGGFGVLAASNGAQTLDTTLPSRMGQA